LYQSTTQNPIFFFDMTTITTSHRPSQEDREQHAQQQQQQQQQDEPQQEPLTSTTTAAATAAAAAAADTDDDDDIRDDVSIVDPDPTVAFRKTIALNNTGVQLLDRGEPGKAAKALTSAFYVFKKAYYKQKHQLPSMLDFQGTYSIDKVQSILLNANTQQPRRCPAPASGRVSSSSSGSSSSSSKNPPPAEHDEETDPVSVSVYKNPIHLPPDFDILQETVGFLSTTITYNLALSNHLCGVELYEKLSIMGADPTTVLKNTAVMKHFQSAGRLYEYAIRLERARTHQHQVRRQQLLVSPYVLMSILNNLGHLHTTLQNVDQATKCYSQLQSTLMYMVQGGRHRPPSSSRGATQGKQHQHMIQIFLENASVGLQTTRMTAAAA
jgi:hypothetical protein